MHALRVLALIQQQLKIIAIHLIVSGILISQGHCSLYAVVVAEAKGAREEQEEEQNLACVLDLMNYN
jgi:hypothetical protein